MIGDTCHSELNSPRPGISADYAGDDLEEFDENDFDDEFDDDFEEEEDDYAFEQENEFDENSWSESGDDDESISFEEE